MKVITLGDWKIKDKETEDAHEKLMKAWLDYTHQKTLDSGVKPPVMRYYKKTDGSLDRIWMVDFDDQKHSEEWFALFRDDAPEEGFMTKWMDMISSKRDDDYIPWVAISIHK